MIIKTKKEDMFEIKSGKDRKTGPYVRLLVDWPEYEHNFTPEEAIRIGKALIKSGEKADPVRGAK